MNKENNTMHGYIHIIGHNGAIRSYCMGIYSYKLHIKRSLFVGIMLLSDIYKNGMRACHYHYSYTLKVLKIKNLLNND